MKNLYLVFVWLLSLSIIMLLFSNIIYAQHQTNEEKLITALYGINHKRALSIVQQELDVNYWSNDSMSLLMYASLEDLNQTGTIKLRPENNIYLGLFGNASIISINYERIFYIKQGFFITGQLGIGYNEEFTINIWGSSSKPESFVVIPHHITGNIGKGKHCFEFGLGGTIINGNTEENYLFYPIIGYRIQPLQSSKFVFRIFGSIPFTGIETEDILFSPIGLSFGTTF